VVLLHGEQATDRAQHHHSGVMQESTHLLLVVKLEQLLMQISGQSIKANKMIRFKKLFTENAINLPDKEDTLDIDRKDMPQVKSADVKDFIAYLKKNDIYTEKKLVDPSKLKATQGQFHKEKIVI